LPWDDASPSVTNLSDGLHKPAGQLGHIRVGQDGHLYAGAQRIRFFGVNLSFGANVPRQEEAEKIAARLAKFGINIVRFHHLDGFPFPEGIRAGNVPHTRSLDPVALDRLDYLVAQLKRNGIYANFNLLVFRPFTAADGLPAEIERLDWKVRHVVGFFFPPMLELQKEYARTLLGHRNPYTSLSYAQDPAVALVEINNENGLFQAWLDGQIDQLPGVFVQALQSQWNGWLRQRYGTTDNLRRAWGATAEPLGNNLLVNADFSRGLQGWILERHAGAQATATLTEDVPDLLRGSRAVRINVTRLGTAGWHVQFNQPGLTVEANHAYTLTFWVKADKSATTSVAVGQAHEPWQSIGLSTPLNVTTEWQPFQFLFRVSENDTNARVNFSDLARQTGSYWLAGISFRPGGTVGLRDEERIEEGTVPVFFQARSGERTIEALRDWLRFLWETEDRYWQAMARYLKDDLKVKALVTGTIIGTSTPNLMAKFDMADTHAYWQHPIFPGQPWDPENWFVPNLTMVNERGGTLPDLARRRLLGKPQSVSEYNHPAPNTYGSEAFLLLAAYAAMQDWDAIYAYAYAHSRPDGWDARRIPNFFDIDQHPTKLVTLIPAIAMFGRADVIPAPSQVVVSLDKEREIDLLRNSRAWELVHAGHLGVPAEAGLIHRVAIATDGQSIPAGALGPEQVSVPGSRIVSETGELVWDLSEPGRGVVSVNTAKSKAVIGFGGRKRFDLGGVVIEPGNTLQNGWCTITVTALTGNLLTSPAGPVRLLITATGYVENTDMGWKNPERSSVGSQWGRAPSLVEGIPAGITLPVPAGRVQVWALDERGQRKAQMPVDADVTGRAVITIGPAWQTLWYEVIAE
jgi:hypothetical protein